MAKKDSTQVQLDFGGGELRTREDGTQYVYDPTSKKGYMLDSAQGQFLLGNDPSKAKNSGGNERYMIDAFKNASKPSTTMVIPKEVQATTTPEQTATQKQISQIDKQIQMLTEAAQGEGLSSERNQKIKELKKQKEYLSAGFNIDGSKKAVVITKPGEAPQADVMPGPKVDTGTGNVGGTVTGQATDQGQPQETAVAEQPTTGQTIQQKNAQEFQMQRDDFFGSLGNAGSMVKDQVATAEKDLGRGIDTSNPQLQSEIAAAIERGASTEEIQTILTKYPIGLTSEPYDYLEPSTQDPKIAELEGNALSGQMLSEKDIKSAKDAFARGYLNKDEYIAYLEKYQPSAADTLVDQKNTPEVQYTTPPEVSIGNFLANFGSMDYGSLTGMLATMGGKPLSEMSSAELNQMMLAQLSLGQSNEYQNKLTALYDKMKERTMQAYLAASDDIDIATGEIDNILSGKDSTATSLEALMIRVAKQSMETNKMSLDAQEKYLKAEYEFTYNKMLEQNSRLEGYMKAKLNWMGAGDSSAGLTTIAMAVDNAQQTLLLYQGKHEANMIQLEAQKTQMMNNFYNSVQEQLLTLQGRKDNAMAEYNAKLDEIEANELASTQEAQTLQLNVLSSLVTNMHALDQEQKQWEYQMAQDAYEKSWQETQWAYQVQQDAKNQAASALDMMMSSYAGMDFGSLDPQSQEIMVNLSRMLGLPDEYARTSLANYISQSSGGGGGGGGYGSSNDYSWFSYVMGQVPEGMDVDVWMESQGYSSSEREMFREQEMNFLAEVSVMGTGEGEAQTTPSEEGKGALMDQLLSGGNPFLGAFGGNIKQQSTSLIKK